MKMKTTRICSRKGCKNEFRLFKTTDKYCSPSCAHEDQKARPKKKRTAIKPVSEKRKRESYLYTKKRKTFLSKPENKFCPVCKAAFEGLINIDEFNNHEEIKRNKGFVETSEVHHVFGRRGKFLNYVPYWLAVSHIGHVWIHANPKQAYSMGFLGKNTTVNI